jgi:hypothetical protein
MPITLIKNGVPVTANGEFSFETFRVGTQFLFSVSGAFGGGTATLGFVDSLGVFTPYGAGPYVISASAAVSVYMPPSPLIARGMPALSLVGATNPALTVILTKIYQTGNVGPPPAVDAVQGLGANVAAALAKPIGTPGAAQLNGDPLSPTAIQLPDMTTLTAPARSIGLKNGQLAVGDGVTVGGVVVAPTRYAGVEIVSFNGQPKSSAFIKIVGIPILANKMVSGAMFRLTGNVIVHGNETLSESTSLTAHRLGIAFLAGSTVPMNSATAAQVWLGEVYSDMPQLVGSFLRHEFGGAPLILSATNLGNTEYTIRTVNGVTSMSNNGNSFTGPTYVLGVANELCVMFGGQSGNSGNYAGSNFKVSYNLTLEYLN